MGTEIFRTPAPDPNFSVPIFLSDPSCRHVLYSSHSGHSWFNVNGSGRWPGRVNLCNLWINPFVNI